MTRPRRGAVKAWLAATFPTLAERLDVEKVMMLPLVLMLIVAILIGIGEQVIFGRPFSGYQEADGAILLVDDEEAVNAGTP